MFSRILVATDLSDASDCVVGQAAVLRKLGAREASASDVRVQLPYGSPVQEVLDTHMSSRCLW